MTGLSKILFNISFGATFFTFAIKKEVVNGTGNAKILEIAKNTASRAQGTSVNIIIVVLFLRDASGSNHRKNSKISLITRGTVSVAIASLTVIRTALAS